MIATKNEIRIIFQENKKDTKYTLSRIDMEGITKYALAIDNKCDGDFELVGRDRGKSEELFRRAVECELSPIHLKEVVSDYIAEDRFLD